ncbi:MAG: HAMP domain-containing histidine kinase [Nitrospina sp.]|nr:HAMP domain-containing histidine kinase [Nitrospina sp.]
MRNTLVFRLTVLYGSLFLVFSTGIYFWATQTFSHLHLQNIDDVLTKEMTKMQDEYDDEEDGVEELWEYFREEGEALGKSNAFYRLFSADQKNLVTSDLTAWQSLSFPASHLDDMDPGEKRWDSITLPGHGTPVRVLTMKTRDGRFLQVGIDTGQTGKMRGQFNMVLLVALLALLILGSLSGGFIVKRAMRGVRRATETALKIGEHNLETRLPLRNEGEEIDRLAMAFNLMLQRIASLIKELREVSDNVAHDLKRPVIRIRSVAEMMLTQPGIPEEGKDAAGMIIEECDRLVGTVHTMLEIARLDAAGRSDPRQTVDLTELCRTAVDLFGPAAEDRGMHITLNVPDQPVLLQGDPGQLQRALANLLDNALLYAGRGTLAVSVQMLNEEVRIEVLDEGPGVPKQLQSRIFERFFREDPSRSEPGSGLGLSLVSAIARAHGGQVHLESEPGAGCRFSLIFPKTLLSPSRPESVTAKH